MSFDPGVAGGMGVFAAVVDSGSFARRQGAGVSGFCRGPQA
ncbi:hypothetical protein SAMN04490179_2145 [Pseudomonas antarctica]|uniref:Uncharacterized protein n=1 Tax=Pseudomonas antarctica TaxID=219572 RepID=A0A1G9Y3I2_9PSED|nr:hypothetical protein [Pseudomonas antarctica]KAF2410315.1 hypothetical protein PSAN_27420 [Pseudomonas antarctica]SDN03033.1 hypothetical protein SAMN04490179_2145 [Pseudomonas antarctica]